MDTEGRIAVVASTWAPGQQLHPGNVAWHGSGCDGAPRPDVTIDGEGWFADVWRDADVSAVEGHFSPALNAADRASAFRRIRKVAPPGSTGVVADSPMALTMRHEGAIEMADAPYFLLQHRRLDEDCQWRLPAGYLIVTAAEVGEQARVAAHCRAWAPARIKRLLGLAVTGEESPSSFTLEKYREMKTSGIYRSDLDLVVVTDDGEPVSTALGWLDEGSRSVLFEPVGTVPGHARKGLSRAVCCAVMNVARGLGASRAVVGPRGDEAYPVPRRLYESIGFTTLARTEVLTWR